MKKSSKQKTLNQSGSTMSPGSTISRSGHTLYTAEFRQQVLDVWNSGVYLTVPDCARSYGIKESTLYTWVNKIKHNPQVPVSPDVAALKRENIRLQMELEVLKKAAIYFATHAK